MSQTINEITKWFEAQRGSHLTIHKKELSIGLKQITDIDKLELQLEKVEIKTNLESQLDDYFAVQELSLYGDGKLQSDQGEVELPDNVYKIPLTPNMTTRKEKNELLLNTERAEYSFLLH